VVDVRTDSSGSANNDVIHTDVMRSGEATTRIVNVYDQKPTQSGERPVRMLNWQRVIRQGRTVLAADFTAHCIWGTADAKSSGMLRSGKT